MHAVLVATVLSLAVLPGGPAAGSPDLRASVRAYEEAANSHDWNRIARFLGEHSLVELGDDLALVGRERIRALHEWERAMGTEIHYTDCVTAGRTVTCRASERNDFLRIAELGAIEYSASSITFEGGRCVRMTATLSDASAEAVSRYMQPFLEWAGRADAKATGRFLNPDGSFAFGYDAAMTFKRLLRVYVLTRGAKSRAL